MAETRHENMHDGTGRWMALDAIFVSAMALSPDEREAYIDQACGEDLALRKSVEQLLREDAAIESFLEAPLVAPTGKDDPLSSPSGMDSTGTSYRITGLLGVGGMGIVYRAEQGEPFEREVALKVIRRGQSAEVLRRFEGERQALALMNHPNVASVHDSGYTDLGSPFIVMEYVPGLDVRRHCDQERLDLEARVRLFLDVCDGVQHAHQKGLIHRDLKPSNILVKTAPNNVATAKVIDFGIVKSTQHKLISSAVHTQLGAFVGTPTYASPEQIAGNAAGLDIRSDVYSLGATLYELVVGVPPFDMGTLIGKSPLEAAKVLVDGDIPLPKVRFAVLKEREGVAERRRVSAARLQNKLSGDLSWILMKALERRPDDRYASVLELRRDLERWLQGRPVEARRTTAVYRAKKFFLRHRLSTAVVFVSTLLLVATSILAGIGFVQAARSAEEARKAAEEARLAADFQVEQLKSLDPRAMGKGIRARLTKAVEGAGIERGAPVDAVGAELERLLEGVNFTDIALSELEARIVEPAKKAIDGYERAPLLQARLWHSLADILEVLGLIDAAIEPRERALRVRRSLLGDGHVLTLSSQHRRGLLRLRKGDYEGWKDDIKASFVGLRWAARRRRSRLPEGEAILCEDRIRVR